MERTKTVLIVIDGADTVKKASDAISAALEEYHVVVRPAESFVGTDLLPAHAFFLGCGMPKPASFAYIAEMLSHINLSGRPCGVFSQNKAALNYLSNLVKDSGAAKGKPLLIKDEAADSILIKKWVREILP